MKSIKTSFCLFEPCTPKKTAFPCASGAVTVADSYKSPRYASPHCYTHMEYLSPTDIYVYTCTRTDIVELNGASAGRSYNGYGRYVQSLSEQRLQNVWTHPVRVTDSVSRESTSLLRGRCSKPTKSRTLVCTTVLLFAERSED